MINCVWDFICYLRIKIQLYVVLHFYGNIFIQFIHSTHTTNNKFSRIVNIHSVMIVLRLYLLFKNKKIQLYVVLHIYGIAYGNIFIQFIHSTHTTNNKFSNFKRFNG